MTISKFLTLKFTMKIIVQWIRNRENDWKNYNGVQVTGRSYNREYNEGAPTLRDPNKVGLLPEGTFEYDSYYYLSENQLPYYWWITAGAFYSRDRASNGAIYYKDLSPPYRSNYG